MRGTTVVPTVAESEPSVRHDVVYCSLELVVVLQKPESERAALACASVPMPPLGVHDSESRQTDLESEYDTN